MSLSQCKDVDGLLLCPTPQAWLQRAINEQELLLIDHANCEKKAASTALAMLYRYVEHSDLLDKLSRLAREELRHFEQVISLMQARKIKYRQIASASYAAGLHTLVAQQEPLRLVDTLLVGGIIEARSYERFRALVPLLDTELANFYESLLRSEYRHFQDYFALATRFGEGDYIDDKLLELQRREAELISKPDPDFRFHSGVPI